MAIKIGSNIASIQAQRRLGESTSSLSKIYEKLSSGKRINRGSDDAASLAIAEALNATSRIFSQAVRNVSDTVSAVTISASATSAMKDITIRKRELAQQSANGTYSSKQRDALNKESRELTNEYNRIIETTSFNGQKLLANPWDTLTTQMGIGAEATLGYKFADELSTKLTGGSYFILDGVEDYYVWFTKDGVGTDPLAFDSSKGIEVDLSTTITTDLPGTYATATVAFPSDIAATQASATVTLSSGDQYSQGGAGDSFYLMIGSYQKCLWFNVNGTNSDPGLDLGGGSLEIAIDSSWSDLAVADTIRRAITDWDLDAWGVVSADFVRDSEGLLTNSISFTSSQPGVSPAPMDSTSNSPFISTSQISRGNMDATAGSQFAASGNGDSFYLMLPSYKKNIWFNVDGSNSNPGDPLGYGAGSLRVQVNSWDSQVTISAAVKSAIDADSGGAAIVTDNHDGTLSFADSTRGYYSSSNTTTAVSGPLVASQTSNGSNAIISSTSGLTSETIALAVQSKLEENGNFTVATGTAPGELSVYNTVSGLVYAAIDVNTGIVITDITSSQATARLIFGDARGMTQVNHEDLSTQLGALEAITTLDNRLDRLSKQEGVYGSIMSRLSVASNVLQSSTENFKAAESRLMDADVAQESANLVRTQILQQAASSVLAQANQAPALALALLR